MSKALVIKGADFSTNKVATIAINDPVPCTAISITPTTITANMLGTGGTIVPTLTPSDTTDTVTYTSSNTNVATVSSSGVVTIVGIGTATITATCGIKTATCSITVANVEAIANYVVGACVPSTGYGASFDQSVVDRFTGVGEISTSGNPITDSEVIETRSGSPIGGKVVKAVAIPKGATKVHVHQVGAPTFSVCKFAFYDGQTSGNVTYPSMLKSIGNLTLTLSSSDVEGDILSGATSMTYFVNVGHGAYNITDDVDAAAEALQLAVTFK